MKKLITLLLFGCLLFPLSAYSTPNVPTNVALSSITQTSMTVTWSGDVDADGYNIYWGTTSDNLDQTDQVDQSTRTYTITGLNPGTTYYVAVSAFDQFGETDLSVVKSATTLSDTSIPATPTGFSLTSTSDITQVSATFKWNKNTETDLDHYNIYYGTTPDSTANKVEATDTDASGFTISNLSNSTRYFFAITAVDTSDNESGRSNELIVDTLPDTRPPYIPNGISGELSGTSSITVTIPDVNADMTDFAGNIIYYGTSSGSLNQSVDIGNKSSYVLTNLSEGSTWYFAASAYDIHNNESDKSTEISVKVEGSKSFIGQADKFDGGCFISSSSSNNDLSKWKGSGLLFLFLFVLFFTVRPKRIKTVAGIFFLLFILGNNAIAGDSAVVKNNIIGISGGYYIPSESNFEKYYNDSVFLPSVFYERRINNFLTADVETGYIQEDGNMLTVSGEKTDIDATIKMVPISASIKLNKEILPFIVGYIGIGPDYWYCDESTDTKSDTNKWVGGYHGKVGFKLYNMDEKFQNTGAIIECVYSKIDRFGSNDLDIGGLIFKLGFFYQF